MTRRAVHNPSTAASTEADFLRQLTLERFGRPVPEWHPTPAELRDAQALLLIVDNEAEAG